MTTDHKRTNTTEMKFAGLHRSLNATCCVVIAQLLALACAAQSGAHPIGGEVSGWDGDAVVIDTFALDTIDGNDGTMHGGVSIAPGIFGSAFDFDGADDFINMGNPASLNFGTGAFSLEAWFNWDGGGSSVGNIIRKSDFPEFSPDIGYWLRIHGGSSTLDFFSGETPGAFGEISAPVTANEWHHAVATRDNSGLMSLYVDGMLRSSVSAPGANTTGPAPFTLGAWDDRFGVIELFSGQIDRVGIYDRALTPDEVTHLFLNHAEASSTWTGGAGNPFWSSPGNWNTTPTNGSNLVFAGATLPFAINNGFLSNVGSITFDNTALDFSLGGSGLTISGGVTNNSTTSQQIDLNLTLGSPQQFDAVSGGLSFTGSIDTNGNTLTLAGDVSISGDLSGAGGLTVIDSGDVFLYGTNTYTGGTTVSGGLLWGTTNSLRGDITTSPGSYVSFGQNFAGTYSGNMSGEGTLQVYGGTTIVTLTGANSYTGGTYVFLGGTAVFSTMSNLGTGNFLLFQNGTLRYAAGNTADISTRTVLINAGGAAIDTNGNDVTFANSIGNNGAGGLTKKGAGTLTLSAANTYTGSTTVNGGTLAVDGSVLGAVTVNSGAILGGAGSVGGNVTVASSGIVAPGNSPGTLTVGSLTLNNDAIFQVQLGGTNRGSEFDAVIATGLVTLDGTLQVSLIDPFAPAAGNSFDILDWGSLSGTFDTVALPTLNTDLMWNASQLYTTGVLSVTLAGDCNGNGIVDTADYVVWRKTDGTPGGYNTWRANFGSTLGSGSAAGTGLAPVPEPASWALVGMAFVGALGRRRRGGA